MVVWNGTLEREGQCNTLSSYRGASTLQAACQVRARKSKDRRATPRNAFRLNGPLMKNIAKLLSKRTLSNAQIASKLGVSRWSVRRLAKTMGQQAYAIRTPCAEDE
jgi:hypothetical protein